MALNIAGCDMMAGIYIYIYIYIYMVGGYIWKLHLIYNNCKWMCLFDSNISVY